MKCVLSWMKRGGGGVGVSKPGILFLQRGVNRVRNAAPDRTTGTPPPPPTIATLSPGSTDTHRIYTALQGTNTLCICMHVFM